MRLGSVAEWPIALVLKTSKPKGFVSSNLTASASNFFQYFNPSNACLQVVDLIDFFLSKLSPILKKVTL
jgi:hypothetical protein